MLCKTKFFFFLILDGETLKIRVRECSTCTGMGSKWVTYNLDGGQDKFVLTSKSFMDTDKMAKIKLDDENLPSKISYRVFIKYYKYAYCPTCNEEGVSSPS